jgi:hypothetical protein
VIFKPLRFASWESERGVATNYTTSVTLEDLPSEEILRSAPGIFQEKIAKRYELRVTVMGRWVVAAQLDSQSIDACQSVWRVPGHSVPVQAISLPQAIQEKCLALMSRLGLAFGCLDLIYTPDGEYVFSKSINRGDSYGSRNERLRSPCSTLSLNFSVLETESSAAPRGRRPCHSRVFEKKRVRCSRTT